MNHSKELIHNRELVLNTYLSLISIVTVIGVGGNSLVIFVVVKFSKMQSITNIQIVSLAIADLLHLTAIPQFLLQITGHSFIPSDAACVAYCFISQVNWFAGTLTLTTMSFDRFLAIIYPIRSQKVRSQRNAIISVCATWVVAVLLMIPTFINAQINSRNSTKIICIQSWPSTKAELTLLPTISYTFFLGYALPGLLMVSFYLAILTRLRQLRQKRKEHKRTLTSSNKTTVLVLMIVTVFLLCNLPYWINQWHIIFLHQNFLAKRNPIQKLLDEGVKNHTTYKEYENWLKINKSSMGFRNIMIAYFCQMTSYLNSALNPILYSFLSAQFRASFASVMRGKCGETTLLTNDVKCHSKNVSAKHKSMSIVYGNKSNILLSDPNRNRVNEDEIFESYL